MKMVLWVLVLACCGSIGLAADHGSSLPRSRPEAQGVSSSAVLDFVATADRKIDTMHSFVLVRHGQVIAETWWAPYSAESPHSLYSLSKSFTSTAVGMAVAEGKLNVDDEVLKFFPDDAPANPSANLKAMRVRDLLRMNTGHQSEPPLPPGQPWTKSFLAHPVPNKPGTRFLYNTPATYMLSAIVQKVTGRTVLDYLRPRLFEPLGIDNPTWGTSPEGISLGGYGLNIRTEDIAKLGQLYLQKGRWDGKQLLPESWVEAATSRQTSNGSNPGSDWEQGYGYQFWRCRNNAFRGDGAFGQYCVVLPDQDAVIAITSGVKDMQAVLNLAWEKLLPAMKADPLPADEAAWKQLQDTLSRMSMPTPEPSGKPAASLGKTFEFPSQPITLKLQSLRMESGEKGGATLVATIDGKERRIDCGEGRWIKGRFAAGPLEEQPAASSGAWTGDALYTAKICFYETPFTLTWRLKFVDDEVSLESESNVGFGPTKQPVIKGKAK